MVVRRPFFATFCQGIGKFHHSSRVVGQRFSRATDRATTFHQPTPFLRLAGCKRQPGQILGQQLAVLGVIGRSQRKEKPAQGPVRSIRWRGSNTIMPRSHPWPGPGGAGKSRARGPAIATPRTRTPPRPILHFAILVLVCTVAPRKWLFQRAKCKNPEHSSVSRTSKAKCCGLSLSRSQRNFMITQRAGTCRCAPPGHVMALQAVAQSGVCAFFSWRDSSGCARKARRT